MALMEIKNLKKTYDNGQVEALKDINLEINQGEFISIIGPSGSGKSTLLNMIGTLDYPTSGDIIIDGKNIYKHDLSQLRSDSIGFIFQLHNLIPNLSVLDNVQIPLIGKGLSSEEMENKAAKLLVEVGLENKLKRNPTELSGGQRQRVAIARALANNPSIILADEPTGSLDTKTTNTILNLLKEIHEKENVTLIIVTHELEVAELADRTIKIRDGEIIEDIIK